MFWTSTVRDPFFREKNLIFSFSILHSVTCSAQFERHEWLHCDRWIYITARHGARDVIIRYLGHVSINVARIIIYHQTSVLSPVTWGPPLAGSGLWAGEVTLHWLWVILRYDAGKSEHKTHDPINHAGPGLTHARYISYSLLLYLWSCKEIYVHWNWLV